MEKLRVDVKACDIKRGEVGNTQKCPIAHAIHRVRRRMTIEVYENSVNLYGAKSVKRGALTKRAAKFVNRFDNDQIVKPFSFVLKLKEVV